MAFAWGRRKVISGGRIGAWKSMKKVGAVRGEKLGQQKPLSSLSLSICPFPLHPLLVLPPVPTKSGSAVSKAGEMACMSMAMSSLSSPAADLFQLSSPPSSGQHHMQLRLPPTQPRDSAILLLSVSSSFMCSVCPLAASALFNLLM